MRKMSAAQPKLEISAHVMAKATTLVSRLSRYHSPNAASRVVHIALATRDQMHMGVVNHLPRSWAAVHSDIEATHRRVLFHSYRPELDQVADLSRAFQVKTIFEKKVPACRFGITSVCNSVTG